MNRHQFSLDVMNRYGQFPDLVAKSMTQYDAHRSRDTIANPPVGHPTFNELAIGQIETCNLAVAFLDMRAMTARSFWQPLTEVTRLSHAVLGQVAAVVQESGGYVLGLRGDGLMAGWGNAGSDPTVDVAMAMAACAFSLDAVENALNELLRNDGIEPVQLCAGADYGEVCFTRTGTPESSEVNIVGHPANFAAK
ncbi:MAG: adenylate/guanylate cyclase domain-containing protein, partial [Acidimicrobiales bacterium]